MHQRSMRHETDFIGSRDIPADAYWGVHTARAVENFPISGQTVSCMPELIKSLAFVKKAAARTNFELGVLDAERTQFIERAVRRADRGQASRAVRGGRDPGRCRHFDQHECERGDRQSRARADGPATRPLRAAASQRPCQRVAEHQRCLPDGAAPGCLVRHRRAAGCHGSIAPGFRAQGRRVWQRAEDRSHPIAGCGPDDAWPGVRRLRHHDRRGRGALGRSSAAPHGGEPRSHRRGDGDQCAGGLHRARGADPCPD